MNYCHSAEYCCSISSSCQHNTYWYFKQMYPGPGYHVWPWNCHKLTWVQTPVSAVKVSILATRHSV